MIKLSFRTSAQYEMLDITADLKRLVCANNHEKGWQNGALAIFCPHTTCGLTVNEGADPDVRNDMLNFFARNVPEQPGYFRHAEGNSAAHIKSTLHGVSLLLLVEQGQICLGTWQSVYLCEGDGPRQRSLWLQWLPGDPGIQVGQ